MGFVCGGNNVDKRTKNYMKSTKSKLLAQNSGWKWWTQPNYLGSREIPHSLFPQGETLGIKSNYVIKGVMP